VFAASAGAEPIAVEYYAIRIPFKQGTTGTDILTFELFEDSGCTTLLDSESLFANDSMLKFYVDKAQRLKGGAKLPKAVRVRAVVDAPFMASAPYLRVTGQGIEPVGSDCQLQASGPVTAIGPTGPQGDPGPQGNPGADGADGADGAAGAQGPQGDPGADGADGAPGAQGDPGSAGAQGAAGPQGPQGDPGADGADGAQGAPGNTGLDGADGAQGPQGNPGLDGADGAQGPQGNPGLDGADGAQGPQGVIGPQGPQGDPGADGADGADGAPGPQGNPGLDGADGAQGPQGNPGLDGADGAQGPQGAVGPQGPQGDPGPQGSQGDPGADGVGSGFLGGGTGGVTLTNGNNNFIPMFNGGLFANAESSAAQVVPVTGTISNFYVRLSGSPGNGKDYTFFVRVDGADTAVSCAIADGNAACSDTTNTVVVNAGSLLVVRAFANGNPTARSMAWTAVFSQ
jgi:hypothetical protein